MTHADEKYGKDNHIWGRPVDPIKANKNKSIGETIKDLRKNRGLNQVEFGIAFANFSNRGKVYKATTISGWEHGVLPPHDVRRQICEFFGNIDYELLDCADSNEYSAYNSEKYQKIYENLASRYHAPVWCEFDSKKHTGSWAIVDNTRKCLILSANRFIPFEQINFDIFTFSIFSI